MEPRLERGFTLQEALEMAYADDIDIAAIYTEPPEVSVLTDEDSGDDDRDGDLDRLTGRQLRAPVEIQQQNNLRINSETIEQNTNSNADRTEPLSEEKQMKFSWVSGDLQSRGTEFHPPDYSEFSKSTPVEMFEIFWGDDVIEYLVQETKKYAIFKNAPDPNITAEELKCALAILILSGYDVKPARRNYWDSKPDLGNELVKKSMRKNRFEQIMQFLHVADNNNPDINDKAWKIRPLMDKLKDKFLKHFVPEENINFDESMVKYFGRHSCKQFIRGKPIRFGYKMWSLNTKGGYLINFDLYQGKNPRISTSDEVLYGKSTAPLVTMLREFPECKKRMPYKLYTDNLFTSATLLRDLRDSGIWVTGMMRDNRLPKELPLPKEISLRQEPRGKHYSILDRETGIVFVRWIDNNIVTVASTCFGVEPISTVKRFCRSEKKMIQVPRPNLIGKYNSSMGGTDLMDQNVSRYRIAIRSKKWWWSLFSWMLDISIHNAWFLYNKGNDPVPQLNFRRDIVTTYLSKYGTAAKSAGRPSSVLSSSTACKISENIRYDRTDHLLTYIPNNKRRRCAHEDCKSSVRTMCLKCDLGLYIDCNVAFHRK